MVRQVFYSFHHNADYWRASQIRFMAAVEGNTPVSDNEWEAITKNGSTAIRKWIDEQMDGKSCTIVLIGANTAGRLWIHYEIEKSWNEGRGLLGINIHGIKDEHGNPSFLGKNPFEDFIMEKSTTRLSNIVRVYNPPYYYSTNVCHYIGQNLKTWVEEAIAIRDAHSENICQQRTMMYTAKDPTLYKFA